MEFFEKFHVRYDAHQKTWKAHNSRRFYIHKNKRNVLLWGIKQEHPHLWKCVHAIACACSLDGNGKGIPLALIDSLIKACQLISNGKVFKGCVLSQNGKGAVYQVCKQGIPPVWTCTCKHFERGGFDTVAYGLHCKHTLAQLIAHFVELDLQPYTSRKPQTADQGDFLQSMDDRQAKRLQDPAYVKALEDGGDAVFWYVYQEIINEYTNTLYWNAQDVLHLSDFEDRRATCISNHGKEVTAQEIRSWTCSEFDFEQIFEIPELDGQQYDDFWMSFYNHTRNGQFPRLKAELIRAFEELL